MTAYHLLLKMMQCVDRNRSDVPGLPLKYIITMKDKHIGYFDERTVPERNVMCFDLDGEYLWTIVPAPEVYPNFAKSWSSIFVDDSGALMAKGSNNQAHQIDINSGRIIDK